jgi:glutamate carboxypeptidase
LRDRTEDMVQRLAELVRCESPSSEPTALARCSALLAGIAEEVTGYPVILDNQGRLPVLHVGRPDAPIVLLGHLDTVHPVGTLELFPFLRRDGRIWGPGALDMKAGLVQALYALALADSADHACLTVTADEEVGSPFSRPLIERLARQARAVLVLEPSSDGQLKTARKGVSTYRLEFLGRAAHAGLEPQRGANACVALAAAVLDVVELVGPEMTTTVTPTVAAAGTTANTVPDRASLTIDVRAATIAEQRRIDEAIRRLAARVDGVRIEVVGGINRPPLPAAATARLFTLSQRACRELGLASLGGEHVGGGSDGNFAAAAGAAVLDGLGAVGGGAHTDGEWIFEAALAERAALLARLVELLSGTAENVTREELSTAVEECAE